MLGFKVVFSKTKLKNKVGHRQEKISDCLLCWYDCSGKSLIKLSAPRLALIDSPELTRTSSISEISVKQVTSYIRSDQRSLLQNRYPSQGYFTVRLLNVQLRSETTEA